MASVYLPVSPAGGMSASALDMSHFMIAHLQDGRYRDARILSQAIARQMRSRVFGHVPVLNGMMHGFYEMNRKGRRIFGRAGGLRSFHSRLVLLPDEQLGILSPTAATGEWRSQPRS